MMRRKEVSYVTYSFIYLFFGDCKFFCLQKAEVIEESRGKHQIYIHALVLYETVTSLTNPGKHRRLRILKFDIFIRWPLLSEQNLRTRAIGQ